MKRINEYRTSEHFNLMGTELDYLCAVRDWARGLPDFCSLIAVVPSGEREYGDIDLFTVRILFNSHKLVDYLVEAATHKPCEVKHSVVISNGRK